jgi:3-hydroxyacyl-CoA dehydrogenase
MMIARERQAARLLVEGALPDQIDRVLRNLGLPMGTFELQDMAGGIELTYRARQRAGQKDWLIEQLHARGRTGQRAGRGYYRYEPGKRRPLVDPEVTALIEEASRVEGIERRAISDEEVHDRLVLLMINEGAKLLAEGIVERASDIDLVWQLGYGWPDWKGGPMYYADMLELQSVVTKLTALRARHGDLFRPAELLVQLAEASERLSNVRTSR